MLLSFYVDDMVSGSDDHNQAVELANESYNIMKQASMELSKWITNSPNLLQATNIPENKRQSEKVQKILGIIWNSTSDEFEFSFESIIELAVKLKPSKRTVLRIVQKIYDPIGFLHHSL